MIRARTPAASRGTGGSAGVVGVLAFAGLASTFMFTLVVPIQAQLPELLDAERDDTAWVVTITVLVSAVMTPISGRLGDLYGKRRIVLLLVASMTVGSIMAALVEGLAWMIVARALQGVMAGVIPLGMAIMRDVLPARRLPGAIALLSATLGIGGSLGLPVSALVTEHLHWRGLFWLSAALGVLVFVLVALRVPVSGTITGGRFDYVGAIGLAAGIAAVLLAVSRGSVWGWGSPLTIGCAAGGVAILTLWGVHQWHARMPLLDLRVASRPAVLRTNLTSLAVGFSLFAANVLFPQILEIPRGSGAGFGMSLLVTSLLVMPSGIVILLISPLSGRLAARWGPRRLLITGCVAILFAYSFVAAFHTELWHIVLANVLVGVGIAFSFASVPLLIISAVPAEDTGASNGLNSLFRAVGTTSASAVLGAILAQLSLPEPPHYPSADAFEVAFIVAAATSALALFISLSIPPTPPAASRAAARVGPSVPPAVP